MFSVLSFGAVFTHSAQRGGRSGKSKASHTNPPTQAQIQAYLDRVNAIKNCGTPDASGIGRVYKPSDLLALPPPGPDPRIQVEDGWIALYYPNEYPIELSRIKGHKQLLWWVHHLCGKPWMDRDRIEEFIERVCQAKGWKLYEGGGQ